MIQEATVCSFEWTGLRADQRGTQGWAGSRSSCYCKTWLHNSLLPSGRGWINISGVERVGRCSIPMSLSLNKWQSTSVQASSSSHSSRYSQLKYCFMSR
jgi:hypothetical protein